MFFTRIGHISNIIFKGIKSLTDTHWVLICLFIVLNTIDWGITTWGRFCCPNFQELNPLFNSVVENPYLFSTMILITKMLGTVCIVGIVICIDKIKFKYVSGTDALVFADVVIGGVLVLLIAYNVIPLVVV